MAGKTIKKQIVMKKLFLMAALMLSMVLTAQLKEYNRVYFRAAITYDGKDPSKKNLITVTNFNYQGKPVVEVIFEDGKAIYYDLISEIKTGVDDAEHSYSYGRYILRDTDTKLLIQVYDDEDLGIRFIADGVTVQYY